MKTNEQINTEITTLREMKPNVREYTAFGDSNHDAIEAQVDVLREHMSTDDVYDRFGEDAFEDEDEFCQSDLDAALSAQQWLCGESEEAPSAGWSSLVS